MSSTSSEEEEEERKDGGRPAGHGGPAADRSITNTASRDGTRQQLHVCVYLIPVWYNERSIYTYYCVIMLHVHEHVYALYMFRMDAQPSPLINRPPVKPDVWLINQRSG